MQVSGVPVAKPQQRKDHLRGSIFLPVRGSDVDKIRWKKGRKKKRFLFICQVVVTLSFLTAERQKIGLVGPRLSIGGLQKLLGESQS
jgi:hypothetical protein